MEEIKHHSNAELLELFELATEGAVDPGPKVVDAIADIENAGEDKESVKKARKILIKYLVTYMFGEEAEIFEDEEEEYERELNGGKRRRKSRKSRKLEEVKKEELEEAEKAEKAEDKLYYNQNKDILTTLYK